MHQGFLFFKGGDMGKVQMLLRVLLFVLMSIPVAASCQEKLPGPEEIDLEKIVITPFRYSHSLGTVPASVTIISSQDIENSNAETIVDVLRASPGIVVRDYYGTGNKATVDLRGFGEFAASNTLVLIDGRRVNEIDLSGTAWTQIPLDTVERIEIIRGSGSVLYGDNAVGGTINIITKRGSGKPSVEVETQVGSYQMDSERVTVSGETERLSYMLRMGGYSTNGYRQNSYYRSEDFDSKFIFDIADTSKFTIAANYHDADFGMPGALRESQLKACTRRDTKFPDDDVGEKDWSIDVGMEHSITDDLDMQSHLSYRSRYVDNNLLSSQAVEGRKIDTFSFRPSLVYRKELFGGENKLVGGIDFYRSDSLIDAYSFSGLSYYQGSKTRRTAIDKETQGYYLQNELALNKALMLLAGYRFEKANYSFNSTPQEGPWTSDLFWNSAYVNQALKVNEEALNLGLNYSLNDASKVFFCYTKSFRLPSTDEYYSIWSSPPVNTGLMPQTAHNYEIGYAHNFEKALTQSITYFDMRLRNELYYDPSTYENKNYDKTIHRGIEYSISWNALRNLKLSGQYTFTDAFFKGGSYRGHRIPLVPRHKASLGAVVNPLSKLSLALMLNFTGEQYFINDQAHNYPAMNDYTTLDLKLTFKPAGNASWFIGVNNVFDAQYSEYGAISTVYNERGYYPSPGRNIAAGGKIKF
ncbi:MAG: TonB-dependent receptor [Candidatus Omnitrophota bacterium]|nr:MAG: TonB-dependent receptor [Candidatus Omnitrophota bacterium]